jgi:hypothetical protein
MDFKVSSRFLLLLGRVAADLWHGSVQIGNASAEATPFDSPRKSWRIDSVVVVDKGAGCEHGGPKPVFVADSGLSDI